MAEKNINKTLIFDDTMLPTNRINVERSEQIERIILPKIEKTLEKLRIEKPYLFKSRPSE